MKTERSGNSVSVLLSGNYNNFVCTRDVDNPASDAVFRVEFQKATDLAEEALQKHKKLSDNKYLFDRLCHEYICLQRMMASYEKREQESGATMTDGEKQMANRILEYEKLIEGYKDEWDWRDIIDNRPEDDKMPF